jgi:KDO2-lipid IV(A) lauroyltransferase
MYYVVYGLFWLISLLPLRVLYVISDGLYALTYHVFKYRRDVVMNNLSIAFPEKTLKERTRIAKKFYHNLIDTFIETIKMISAPEKFILKRTTGNWQVVNDIYPTGKSVQIHLGHNFNWEWANLAGARNFLYKVLVVYMPISNKIFDRLFYKIRARSGNILLRKSHMKEDMAPHRDAQYLLGLVADQNPPLHTNAYWFNFFGRPTPFLKGPARGAIANDTAVIFGFLHKTRRGYYQGVFTLAEMDPRKTTEIELTAKFVNYLEDVVRQYPEMWLWSHRRWKWEWKPEYGEVIQ